MQSIQKGKIMFDDNDDSNTGSDDSENTHRDENLDENGQQGQVDQGNNDQQAM